MRQQPSQIIPYGQAVANGAFAVVNAGASLRLLVMLVGSCKGPSLLLLVTSPVEPDCRRMGDLRGDVKEFF
jgi:hypothetical protein